MNRYTDRKEDVINNPRRLQFLNRWGNVILACALGCYLLSLFFLLQIKLATFLVALIPLAIAVLYSVLRLKRVLFIKNLSVSSGILCAVLIVFVTYNNYTMFSLLLAAFFFLTILINTIIFDVKDIEGDKLENIHTIPGTYGLRNTKIICYMLLATSIFFIPGLLVFTRKSLLLIAYSLYIGLYTTYADGPEHLPSWFYGIFVDGEYLFLLVCCGIFFVIPQIV
jgi:4-hydroxybenzoate polyprenyltransferase